jgi:hypothetical protein
MESSIGRRWVTSSAVVNGDVVCILINVARIMPQNVRARSQDNIAQDDD